MIKSDFLKIMRAVWIPGGVLMVLFHPFILSLKARKLTIKGTKNEKRLMEIFVSTGGTKVAIILEEVGPQTKVTISAKKSRFISDLETAQAILDEVGHELTVKKSKRKPTKKKSTPAGLTS